MLPYEEFLADQAEARLLELQRRRRRAMIVMLCVSTIVSSGGLYAWMRAIAAMAPAAAVWPRSAVMILAATAIVGPLLGWAVLAMLVPQTNPVLIECFERAAARFSARRRLGKNA